jgi:hypothetical protein
LHLECRSRDLLCSGDESLMQKAVHHLRGCKGFRTVYALL